MGIKVKNLKTVIPDRIKNHVPPPSPPPVIGDRLDELMERSMQITRERVAAQDQPDAVLTDMGFFGNVWIRSQLYVSAGDFHAGHKHNFDHMSLVVCGAVEVEIVGEGKTIYNAPAFFEVSANKVHHITALEDGTCVYCVFAVRDQGGNPTMTTEEVTDVKRSGNKFFAGKQP